MEKPTLQNQHTKVTYRVTDKQITADDLTDQNNLPAFFTQTKRGIAKAWDEIQAQFTEKTTMGDIMAIVDKYNIRTHYRCRMD